MKNDFRIFTEETFSLVKTGLQESEKSDLETLVKQYMKKTEDEKVTKKTAPNLYDYLKKSYKKDKAFMIKDLLDTLESGSKTFKQFREYSNSLWDKASKIAKEKNSSHLNVLIPPAITKATMTLLKDWQDIVIVVAKKDGNDLIAMNNSLKESGDMTIDLDMGMAMGGGDRGRSDDDIGETSQSMPVMFADKDTEEPDVEAEPEEEEERSMIRTSPLPDKITEAIKGEFGDYGFLSSNKSDFDGGELLQLKISLNSRLWDAPSNIEKILDGLPEQKFTVDIDKRGKLVIAWPKEVAKNAKLLKFYTSIAKRVVKMLSEASNYRKGVSLNESESDYKAVKAEVIDSFTNKEMEKFKNFNEFFAEVDVQNAYEEEWEEGQHTYKPHYKRIYDEFKKGKLKMNESKKGSIKEEGEEDQEGSREDFYSEQIKGDMVAKAWIKFVKEELNHELSDEPSWASVQKYDWNRFGWEMSKVVNKFRMGDKMPDGTEDRMWYRLFLATQGHKDYRGILRSLDGPAYKLKIKQIEKATLDALMNETRKITNSKTLSEAKSVSKNVTQFGLANNMKKSKLRLVPSLAQPNVVVPEKYINKVAKEMGDLLGSRTIRNIGRTMYFEVPRWDETSEKIVAKEIVNFLDAEDLLKESILNRNRNKFLTENKQNKFLYKGSLFLKEAKEIDEKEYQKWLKDSEVIAKATDDAGDEVTKIAGDNKGGLTPDHIKSSKEFKDAKQKFDKAFKAQRDFNKKTPKEFILKKHKDKRAKWPRTGSSSLKENVDIKSIEDKIESAYDKDGKSLDRHDFDYQVQKDGSFFVEFDYANSKMKGYYVVDKNYKKLEYSFVDDDGLDYDESYRVKDLDDALRFIMRQG